MTNHTVLGALLVNLVLTGFLGPEANADSQSLLAFSLWAAQKAVKDSSAGNVPSNVFQLSRINAVLGLVHDEDNRDVIIVGSQRPERSELTLDDLAVSLRAVLVHGKWPQVDLGLIPKKRHLNMHAVVFDGGIENTQLGKDFLEADLSWPLISKTLGLPPSQLFLSAYWLYPEFQCISIRSGAACFESPRIRVGYRVQVVSSKKGGVRADELMKFKLAAAEEWARKIEDGLSELARTNHSLSRLPGLFELAALARALQQMDVRPELAFWLDDYVITKVDTPEEVQFGRISEQGPESKRTHEQRSAHLGQVGGLGEDVEAYSNKSRKAWELKMRHGDPDAIKQAVLASKPRPEALSWTVQARKGQHFLQTASAIAHLAVLNDSNPSTRAVPLSPPILSTNILGMNMDRITAARLASARQEETKFPKAPTALTGADCCPDNLRKLLLDGKWSELVATLKGDPKTELDPVRRLILSWAMQESYHSYPEWQTVSRSIADDRDMPGMLEFAGQFAKENPGNYVAHCLLGQLYQRTKQWDRAADEFQQALKMTPHGAFAHYRLSYGFNQQGNYDKAVESSLQALKLDRRLAGAHNELAYAFSQKGLFDRTISETTKALEIDAKYLPALVNRAAAYYGKGDSDTAFADCKRAIESDPKHAAAYNYRGFLYTTKGEYEKAIQDYDKAIELDAKYAAAYAHRGSTYSRKGEHEKAVRDCNKAIELDPKSVLAYNSRGFSYRNNGQYDKAIADYNRSIELDPKSAVTYNNRGFTYNKMGKYDLAIRDYSKAIEINPKDSIFHKNRGDAYDAMGKYDLAIEDFDRAITLDPKYATAYNNRGFTYNKMGKYDLAIRDYSKAIEINPKDSIFHKNRGDAYDAMGKYDLAIGDYTKAIEINPKYAGAHNRRGLAHEQKGRLQRAIDDYKRAIELDPSMKAAYRNLRLAYEELGHSDASPAAYNKTYGISAQMLSSVYNILGNQYHRYGQLSEAVSLYTKAIQMDSRNAQSYYHRANALALIGRYRDALADYDTAIRIDPTKSRVYVCRGDAYAETGAYDKAISDYDNALKGDANLVFAYAGKGAAYEKMGRIDEALEAYKAFLKHSREK